MSLFQRPVVSRVWAASGAGRGRGCVPGVCGYRVGGLCWRLGAGGPDVGCGWLMVGRSGRGLAWWSVDARGWAGACRGGWYGYGQRAWSPVRAVQLITGIAAASPGRVFGESGRRGRDGGGRPGGRL